jgi:hypothetical protein
MDKLLLLPVFAHLLLVGLIANALGRARVRAAKAGAVKLANIAIDSSSWPDDVRKIANAYANQFEQPLLFLAAVAFILIFGLADLVSLALASLYMATRYAHAYVHTGSNEVMLRFWLFLLSNAFLVLLWLWFGLRLVISP